MSEKPKALDVKIGDRLVYSTGEKEYDAVALSEPILGHHPALKATNYHANVAYLDDKGNRVQVMGAPLLTKAASEGQKKNIAWAEAYNHIGFGKLTLVEQGKVVALQLEKQNEQPRTFGWRNYEQGERAIGAEPFAREVPADKDELEPLPL